MSEPRPPGPGARPPGWIFGSGLSFTFVGDEEIFDYAGPVTPKEQRPELRWSAGGPWKLHLLADPNVRVDPMLADHTTPPFAWATRTIELVRARDAATRLVGPRIALTVDGVSVSRVASVYYNRVQEARLNSGLDLLGTLAEALDWNRIQRDFLRSNGWNGITSVRNREMPGDDPGVTFRRWRWATQAERDLWAAFMTEVQAGRAKSFVGDS